MKLPVFFFLIVIFACSGEKTEEHTETAKDANYPLYIGSYASQADEGIYTVNFNSGSGQLMLNGLAAPALNPSFLASSNGRLISVSEGGEGRLLSFGIDNRTLRLFPIDTLEGVGSAPCYVTIDQTGFTGFVANYMSGDVLKFGLDNEGRFLRDTLRVRHNGSGPLTDRQEAPHAHSIDFNPDQSKLYAADLGADKIFIYDPVSFTQTGEIALDPGDGPRHFTFNEEGNRLYVINELSSTISVFRVRGDSHSLLQKISTLPKSFSDANKTADIHLHPNGKYLYGSNRGHNSIVYYDVDNDGKLEVKGWLKEQVDWPRNFTLSPEGNWLLVANRYSNSLNSYPLVEGVPAKLQSTLSINSPVCIKFYMP